MSSLVLSLLLSTVAWGRPEYATREGLLCSSCHVSAWGGGPRTVYGKVYGSHGLTPGRFCDTDLYSASLRGILYEPRNPSRSMNGLALMEASLSANVPVVEASSAAGELRAVVTYNAAPLASGVREAYARYSVPHPARGWPSFVTVGRFNAPFGLLTDEHRTYTRMQTNMTLNDFDLGAAVSGVVAAGLGYDLAVVNDFQSGGLFTTRELSWASVLNLRWLPPGLPLLLGASQSYERLLNSPSPYATSLYAVISGGRLSRGRVPLSLSLEHVIAHGWSNAALNPYIGSFFVPGADASYQGALTGAASRGYLALLKYELTPRLTILYKLDALVPDERHPGDSFTRHGAGLIFFAGSNLYVDTRVERAFVLRPELRAGTPTATELAAQDDVLVMLRLWL